MLQVLNAARKAKLRVFYALHHRYRPGDYETWKYIAPVQKAAWVRKSFEIKAPKPEELDMSSTQVRSETAIETPRARTVDMKLEVVVIPVSDVDRAKSFYSNLGWRLDADFAAGDDWRVIQFTPPGSGCSVIFGKNVTAAAPGSAQGLYLVVSDIKDARDELLRRGVGISEVFHDAGDVHAGADEPYLFGRLRVSGPDPDHRSYRSYASFSDPDGNGWLLQEVTVRLPGRVDADAHDIHLVD